MKGKSLLKELITRFDEYSKASPIIAGSLGLWSLGVATYMLRSLPQHIYKMFLRHFTTTLTIVNTSDSFYLFLRWFYQQGYANNSRTIKISNGRYGDDDMIKSMGYGTHYFWYKKHLIKLMLSKQTTNSNEKERDEIEMVKFGRSHKIFDEIFHQIKSNDFDKHHIVVYNYNRDWFRTSEQRLRNISTIFLNEGVKEQLLKFIDNFRDREQFHIDNGINHQTAIMLHGPPGTGKTSIIKAIASHYNLDVYMLSSSKLINIQDAFLSLPEHSLIVIEDIDSNAVVHNRDDEDDDSSIMKSLTNIGDVLNTIDGLHCSHGRILIATTNYIEKLDKALLRTGRFDLKLKIDFADKYAIDQMSLNFYKKALPNNIKIKSNLTPASIHHCILNNLDNFDEFIKFVQK